MKGISLLAIIAASLLTTSCVYPPVGDGYDSPGYGDMGPTMLPPLVILDTEPYYFYNGYHYHYLNNRWYYARDRRGPWTDLPRNHYPREVKFKEGNRDAGRGHYKEHDDSQNVRSKETVRGGDRDGRGDHGGDRDRSEDHGGGYGGGRDSHDNSDFHGRDRN